jgi:hypothetical protein
LCGEEERRGGREMHMNENNVMAVAMSKECLLEREGESQNGGRLQYSKTSQRPRKSSKSYGAVV